MPTIQEVTVCSGTVFNHPYESYCNLRPSITLRAAVEDGEDPVEATRKLQAQADALLADHRGAILLRLGRENALKEARYAIQDLQRRIRAGFDPERRRAELDAIAADLPELAAEVEEAKTAQPQGERAIQRAADGGLDDDHF